MKLYTLSDAKKLKAAWRQIEIAMCNIVNVAMEIDTEALPDDVGNALDRLACEADGMELREIEQAVETACRCFRNDLK